MFDSPGLQRLYDRLARRPSHDSRHPDVRLVVRARARDACEYCLLPTRSWFHVDHIIPPGEWSAYVRGESPAALVEGRRGPNHLDNFAWSCPYCNVFKGEAVSGVIGGQVYPLFQPRLDAWNEHFIFTDRHLFIAGLTEVGRVTETVLRFNDQRSNGPLSERHKAIVDGVYPPASARLWCI